MYTNTRIKMHYISVLNSLCVEEEQSSERLGGQCKGAGRAAVETQHIFSYFTLYSLHP